MTARIVILSGSLTGNTIDLRPGVTRVGRGAGSQVRFAETDGGVSSAHASIRIEGERAVLEDAASRNGTFVNGAKVSTCELQSGQVITFGVNGPTARFEVAVVSTERPILSAAPPPSLPLPGPPASPLAPASAHQSR